MYFLFPDDTNRFGIEQRTRNGIRHWHIILFHRNLCLSWRWWSRDQTSPLTVPKFDFVMMFDGLDKLYQRYHPLFNLWWKLRKRFRHARHA